MRESITRLISGAVYVTLLIVSTFFSENSMLFLFGIFMIIAITEFCELVQLPKINSLIIGCSLFLLFSFFKVSMVTKISLIVAALFVSIKLIYLLFTKSNIKLDTPSKYVYLIGYVIIPIIILTQIPYNNYNLVYEPKIIISIFILIWTNDTFAYIVGKTIGKRKLFESISPKKTIEGFVGGAIFSVIIGIVIAKIYLQMPIYFWIIIAIIVSVFGTIGDLVESKFKRIAGVKDSGKIMPGHGGILDRLDSVIFVAPFLYLFLQIIQYYIHDSIS